MIDRLEELLRAVRDEDENEDGEDETAADALLSGPGRPPVVPNQGATGPAEEPERPEEPERADRPERPERLERPKAAERAGTAPEPSQPERAAPGEEPPEAPANSDEGSEGPVPEELERAVRETETLREKRSGSRTGPEDGGIPDPLPALTGEEEPGPGPTPGTDGQAGVPGRPQREGGRAGLELLYRELQRAAEPAIRETERSADKPLPEPAPAPSVRMTMEELDRAMRRDSRRYDGGMTIY